MNKLKVFLAYLKKYWLVAVAIIGFIVFELLMQRRSDGLAKTLEEIEKRHDEEIKAIKGAHDVEEQQHEKNVQQLQNRLAEIERQYNVAEQKLDDKKREEIKQILSDTDGNPDELAKKLSEATGFAVVLPPDDKE